jgi:hypothetical protein
LLYGCRFVVVRMANGVRVQGGNCGCWQSPCGELREQPR